MGRAERDRIFKARHALGEMIQHNHPEHNILIMDVAVPITRYTELLAAMQAEVAPHGLIHYTLSHAGNGNVHLNIAGRKDDPTEWALVQADIVAREAGLFMPVYMEGDNFRIVLRQPPGLYKKAWELADRHEQARETVRVQEHKEIKNCI